MSAHSCKCLHSYVATRSACRRSRSSATTFESCRRRRHRLRHVAGRRRAQPPSGHGGHARRHLEGAPCRAGDETLCDRVAVERAQAPDARPRRRAPDAPSTCTPPARVAGRFRSAGPPRGRSRSCQNHSCRAGARQSRCRIHWPTTWFSQNAPMAGEWRSAPADCKPASQAASPVSAK